MSGELNGAALLPYEPTTLVRLAINAHVDAWEEPSGLSGRRRLASEMGVTESSISTRINATGERLFEYAADLELYGFADHGRIIRLARHLSVGTAMGDVGPRWWSAERDTHRLGRVEEEPSFDSATEAIMAAEAFAAHHQLVLRRPPNDPSNRLHPRDLQACRQLLGQLCTLVAGPYGVSRDAARLTTILLPLAPDVVADFVRRGGPYAQMVRTFDRSDAPGGWNQTVRQTFSNLLANPPNKLVRRSYWLRSLRRFRLADFRSGNSEPPKRDWVAQQLVYAMRAERAYEGSRRWERRAALWCAGELTTTEPDQWEHVRSVALSDDVLAELLPMVDDMRRAALQLPLPQRALFLHTPSTGWPKLSSSPSTNEMLDVSLVKDRQWSQYHDWKWMLPRTRAATVRLLRDTLVGPCNFRQQLALDTLRACGPRTALAASRTVADVYNAEAASSRPHPVVLERCLVVLAKLGGPETIPIIELAVRKPIDDDLLAQALLAAHELAHREPRDSTGLIAWVASQLNSATLDEELAVIGIRSAVVARRAPRSWLDGPFPSTPDVDSMLTWADHTLHDPLLFKRKQI